VKQGGLLKLNLRGVAELKYSQYTDIKFQTFKKMSNADTHEVEEKLLPKEKNRSSILRNPSARLGRRKISLKEKEESSAKPSAASST